MAQEAAKVCMKVFQESNRPLILSVIQQHRGQLLKELVWPEKCSHSTQIVSSGDADVVDGKGWVEGGMKSGEH